MRCTAGTVVVLTAGILLTMALWPANQGVQLPPVAMGQQEDAKKEEAKKLLESPSKNVQKHVLPGDAITPPRDERFRAVEEKLKERITVSFPDAPLQEAIEYIAQLTNVDILLDKKSILEAGGDPEEIINHNLADYSLSTVLNLVLEPLQLTYRIFDGILIIETKEKARQQMEVHIYNCRDLLEGVEERIEAASMRAADALRGPGGGKGFFSLADEKPTKESKQPAKGSEDSNPFTTIKLSPEQMLIRVLVHSAKGPWEEVHGDGGTITAFDGLLVVRNNQQAQRDVQMVLDMLRAADKQIPARSPSAAPEPPAIEPPPQIDAPPEFRPS
ncbi:MAG: hypothetical protein WD648_03345 [Planctomycetaceae bacterium]